MLNELIPIIKDTLDLDELYIVDGNRAREGFYTLPMHNTSYFLQLPKHLSNKSAFSVKRLVETILNCDEERLHNKQEHDILKEMIDKVLNISDDSVSFTEITKDSFSFAGEDVNIAAFIEDDLIYNHGIDEHTLNVSQSKLATSNEFSAFLKNGEHLGFSAEHIKLVVTSKKPFEPFIKWALKMKLIWLDRIYSSNLVYREKIQAVEATKLKDRFVSLVSHDLRSPFSGILSIMKILYSDQDNPLNPYQKELLSMAIQGGDQLMDMITKLLDISRLQAGDLVLEPKSIQTKQMVDTIFGEFGILAAKKRIELINDIPHHHKVYGDYDLLSVVLRNLILNAIKFCNMGNNIEVLGYEDGLIAVKDSGAGIKPEFLPNLFKREIKTSIPGTEGEKGTGLGLPLCYDIIKAHGGELSVESKPGEGSLFIAKLPEGSETR